jgi:ribonuclease HI
MTTADPDLEQVVARELALLDPDVRRDPERVRAFLHPEFVEFGASGRVWDRTSIAGVTSGVEERITASDVISRRLGPDAVLLTYRSQSPGREALRSSTWIREAGDWLLLFHQGTPTG